MKKCKKRLNKELKKEIKKYKAELIEIEKQDKINALNKKQEKITTYQTAFNGHNKTCNCLQCFKSENREIDQNRQRYENKVKIYQSPKIIALEKLEKDIITRKFESKEIDYLNDLLDQEYILEQLRYLDRLTDQQTELIYNYLQTLTFEMYDNIFASCLDKEILKSELLEKAEIYKFSNGWKKESRINGVLKW